MQFIKANEIQLLNGGYVSDLSGRPIYNPDFIYQQKKARYLDLLSKKIKGKNFESTPVESFEELKREVKSDMEKSELVNYVSTPAEPKRKIHDTLTQESLSWLKFQEEKRDNEKINSFLQQFNAINEFEKFGLFFEERIVKLEKIYTIKEIKEFVTTLKSFLDKIDIIVS